MSHLTKDNSKLLARVRRLKGQIQGIERMLGEGADCYSILQTTTACRGAFNALARELIIDHIDHHLIHEEEATDSIRQTGNEIQEIVKSFLK